MPSRRGIDGGSTCTIIGWYIGECGFVFLELNIKIIFITLNILVVFFNGVFEERRLPIRLFFFL